MPVDYRFKQTDKKLDAEIARRVFGADTIMFDTLGIGCSLFWVDYSANRNNGTARLLGASWQWGWLEDGSKAELYCAKCPAYSLLLEDAWLVVNHIRDEDFCGRGNGTWQRLQVALDDLKIWHLDTHDAARAICQCVLSVMDSIESPP